MFLNLLRFACCLSSSFLSQLIINQNYFSLGAKAVLAIMICVVIFLTAFVITVSPRISLSFMVLLILSVSIVNVYVYAFKGNEFRPEDILAIETAMNVFGGYEITIYPTVFYGIVLNGIVIFAIWSLPRIDIKKGKPLELVVF